MNIGPEPAPFFVVGPSGSGKSRWALDFARESGGEIVNADAFQLYREIPIITAAPTPVDFSLCPHHLYGVLGAGESCDAGKFLDLAEPVIEDIQSRGRLPIVVGGSGMYVKALTHGLNEAPAADPVLRADLERLPLAEIRARLQAADPESAARIEPNNRRYLLRALEISLTAGFPASRLRQAWRMDDPGLRGVALDWPRQELYHRIGRRVREMFAEGAVSEVAAVTQWSDTSIRAIGVHEIRRLLAGELSREQCIAAIQQSTRRYAKRQLTWFRREKWLRWVPGVTR